MVAVAGQREGLDHVGRADEFEAARLTDFAQHVDEPLCSLCEDERYVDAGNRGVVAGVDFLAGFVEREALHEYAADARELDFAGGRHSDLNLQAAERAGAAVDRVEQVFEPRVDLDRRDGDRRHAEVLFELLFELVAKLGDRPPRGPHLAQQRQRDRAVGLHDQLASDVVVGLLAFAAGGYRADAAARRERFDADAIADLQLVRAASSSRVRR